MVHHTNRDGTVLCFYYLQTKRNYTFVLDIAVEHVLCKYRVIVTFSNPSSILHLGSIHFEVFFAFMQQSMDVLDLNWLAQFIYLIRMNLWKSRWDLIFIQFFEVYMRRILIIIVFFYYRRFNCWLYFELFCFHFHSMLLNIIFSQFSFWF